MYKSIRNYIRIVSITVLLICVFVIGIFSAYIFAEHRLMVMLCVVLMALLSIPVSFVMSVVLAHRVTDRILEYNLDNLDTDTIYDELKPMASKFVRLEKTVERQQSDAFERQEEFRTLTDSMSEGILIIDRDMKPLMCNPIAMRLLEYKFAEDAIDEPRSIIMKSVKSAFKGKHTESKIHFEGRVYHLTANPVLQNDEVIGVAVIIIDETELDAIDRMRREFTANVSHELKTPLTSISGFAELMANGMVKAEDVSDFSSNIYNEAQRLIVLVNDIIRLSQIEDDSHLYETSQIDLYDVAHDVILRLEGAAARREVTLELEGESTVIEGVEQIIFEMMRNLCDNAIKYNRIGGNVIISVGMSEGKRAFSVCDTGIGIPAEHQPRIFERFYRVDKSHSKEIGGTGLGLSIVKHGAEYHNARVLLESEEEKGTKITVIFDESDDDK